MDIHPIHSLARQKSDVRDIEQLSELIHQLGLSMDAQVAEAFQRLIELAGSREFLPLYSQIQHYVNTLKWAREGCFNTGYVVPWMNLYASLGSNSHLVSIATHFTQKPPIKEDDHRGIHFKNPMIKTPQNFYGSGSRPVEIHREEWWQTLQYGLSHRRDYGSYIASLRAKRVVKSTQSFPWVSRASDDGAKSTEKDIHKKGMKPIRKRDGLTKRRAVPYTKKIVYDLEKFGSNGPSVGHVAAAADP